MYNFFQIQDIGAGKGKYYAVNYPLRDGIDDESYEAIFKPVRKAGNQNSVYFVYASSLWVTCFLHYLTDVVILV